MRRIGKNLLLLVALVVGCESSGDPSLTEQDAMALGFERLQCGGASLSPIYTDPEIVAEDTEICAELLVALAALASSDHQVGGDPESVADSVSVIVVSARAYASAGAGGEGAPYLMITLDLASRTGNVVVNIPGRVAPADVSWAPKGLMY